MLINSRGHLINVFIRCNYYCCVFMIFSICYILIYLFRTSLQSSSLLLLTGISRPAPLSSRLVHTCSIPQSPCACGTLVHCIMYTCVHRLPPVVKDDYYCHLQCSTVYSTLHVHVLYKYCTCTLILNEL